MTPPHISEQTARLAEGLYVAGDYRNVSSINGAFASGRRAAEALLIDGL
jgi:predicted NAD/FAD-dependent oxidoreductase